MKVRLKDIEPNPFRRTKAYKINPEKVEALRRSIHETGWWENVLARQHPDDPGKVQLAYGHHRLAALRKEFEPEHVVDLIVKSLNDEQVFRIMARENLEEWKHDPGVLLETIRACVGGYAKGLWDLRPEKPRGEHAGVVSWRFAPGFAIRKLGLEDGRIAFDDRKQFPYTADTVAKQIGVKDWKVEQALGILVADEEGTVPERLIRGLPLQVAKDAKVTLAGVHRRTGSSKIVERVAAKIREEHGSNVERRKAIRRIARREIEKHAPRERKGKDYRLLGRRYAQRLASLFTEGEKLFEDLKELVGHAGEMLSRDQKAIIRELRTLAAKASHIADRLEGVSPAASPKVAGLLKGGGA